MPELPEVETIRRDLQKNITGCRIESVNLHTPEVLINNDQIRLDGYRIDSIGRRGKYLLVRLAGSEDAGAQPVWMIVHLRMTGRLYLQDSGVTGAKHVHVSFRLRGPDGLTADKQLVFQDTRRFGRIWVLPADSLGNPLDLPGGLRTLGPEPLDENFTAEVLGRQLGKRPHTPIKGALLDQKVLAGLGNIYADEALFLSGITPSRMTGSLKSAEISRLTASIRKVLEQAVSCQGTTLRDYVDGWNRKGRFQECLQVYGRGGSPCLTCGSEISKQKLAGRTTCWCPTCQS